MVVSGNGNKTHSEASGRLWLIGAQSLGGDAFLVRAHSPEQACAMAMVAARESLTDEVFAELVASGWPALQNARPVADDLGVTVLDR